jgi:hypothetical protein
MEQHHQTSWYPFVAHAELVVENSDVCLTTRVSKLSLWGCHLHLTDTFPAGTSVLVKIYAWPHFFQARGTVCQSEHGPGIGVAFEKIESEYASELEACLLEAQQNRRTAPESVLRQCDDLGGIQSDPNVDKKRDGGQARDQDDQEK